MNKLLPLTELFTSIQGESSLAGFPTTFIRTATCNLRCSWCDTSYSFAKGKDFSFEQILDFIKDSGCRHVCITGGEPLLHKNIFPLIEHLCDLFFIVSVETGGSLPIDDIDDRAHIILDIKCPSSGMDKRNLFANIPKLQAKDEVKFVIGDRKDYDYAKKICCDHTLFSKQTKSSSPQILFSPVFDSLPAATLVEWILEDALPLRLNLQQHKFIWEPGKRSV